MSKVTNCLNTKCSGLIAVGADAKEELGTFWYECIEDIADYKKCPGGVKERKPEKENKIKCPRCGCTLNDSGVTTEDGIVYTCSQCLNRYNANCIKSEYTIKDSGKRKFFESGMQRDSEDKIRYDLIPVWFLERFAEHLTKGAKKYSANNWLKAETDEELERFEQSAWRHFIALLRNETDEDHMAALTFNICGIELVREKLKNKLNGE